MLQPGIDLLERSEDCSKEGPLLIITGGWRDRFSVKREQAFPTPLGAPAVRAARAGIPPEIASKR